jgi:hypothetical protein
MQLWCLWWTSCQRWHTLQLWQQTLVQKHWHMCLQVNTIINSPCCAWYDYLGQGPEIDLKVLVDDAETTWDVVEDVDRISPVAWWPHWENEPHPRRHDAQLCVAPCQTDWCKHLSMAEFTINYNVNQSTKHTLVYLYFGEHTSLVRRSTSRGVCGCSPNYSGKTVYVSCFDWHYCCWWRTLPLTNAYTTICLAGRHIVAQHVFEDAVHPLSLAITLRVKCGRHLQRRPKSFHRRRPKLWGKSQVLYEIIVLGTPWCLIIVLTNTSATASAPMSAVTAAKCVIFDNLSTNTTIASLPPNSVRGSHVIKSILTLPHRRTRICNSISWPPGSLLLGLLRWHKS